MSRVPKRRGAWLTGMLTAALVCTAVGVAAGRATQTPPPTPAVRAVRIESYSVESATARERPPSPPKVVLRSFLASGRPELLLVDPDTLATSVVDAERWDLERLAPAALRAGFADTAYGRALEDARRNEGDLVDAGVTHLRPSQPGINLTVDLCPSRRPLDRNLFLDLVEELERIESPVPVAVAVTGVWMREHPADLAWLVGLDRARRLAVTWVNHSFHHFTDPARPLSSNFLLEPGTNVTEEVLATERALLGNGLVPSVFFRFPGLVSSRALVETVESFGLVPVGSDAWLAKGQWPGDGSIVLVHGNGNEPLGVRRFISLLHQERPAVREHRWLLLDLRQSLVDSERRR
jgi:hypothetical protein